MIKFFRHIRQNLIMENKTGKYLKYAIGEIVLVMIGILLALQVNNWNENRKSLIKELSLVSQLLEDAKADSLFFESRIFFQQKRDSMFSNFININNGISVDSISKLKINDDPFFFRLAYQSNLINNNPNAYDLISPDNIKNKLREYIKRHDYVVNAIELNNRVCEEYGIPLKIKYYEYLIELPKFPLYKDYAFAIEDYSTIAKFDQFKSQGDNYFEQCQQFLKANQELKLLLQAYLKDNE